MQSKAGGSDGVPLKPSPPGSKKGLRGVKISTPIPIHKNEEWKQEGEDADGDVEQDAVTDAHDLMSDDSHAQHSMQPVQPARDL